MTLLEITDCILTGGLLGIIGQGVRTIIGLKKLNDNNTVKTLSGEAPIQLSSQRLLVSLFIGFAAGAIALLIKGVKSTYLPEDIFTIIAAGYSGTDFIEGIFNTYLKRPTGTEMDVTKVKANMFDQLVRNPKFIKEIKPISAEAQDSIKAEFDIDFLEGNLSDWMSIELLSSEKSEKKYVGSNGGKIIFNNVASENGFLINGLCIGSATVSYKGPTLHEPLDTKKYSTGNITDSFIIR